MVTIGDVWKNETGKQLYSSDVKFTLTCSKCGQNAMLIPKMAVVEGKEILSGVSLFCRCGNIQELIHK